MDAIFTITWSFWGKAENWKHEIWFFLIHLENSFAKLRLVLSTPIYIHNGRNRDYLPLEKHYWEQLDGIKLFLNLKLKALHSSSIDHFDWKLRQRFACQRISSLILLDLDGSVSQSQSASVPNFMHFARSPKLGGPFTPHVYIIWAVNLASTGQFSRFGRAT